MRRRVGLAGLVLSMLPAWNALASQPLPQGASRIDSPGRNTASEDSAESLRLNPGNLGFLPAWEARFTGMWCSDTTKVNCGYAFDLATPLPFNLSTGLRLDYVTPASLSAYPYNGFDYTWVTWGVGLKLADWAGIGVSLQHSYSVNSYVDGLWGISAGLSLRPSTHLALAFVAHDINGPSTAPVYTPANGNLPILDRSYVVSAALRPTGRRGLEIGLDVRCMNGTDFSCFNSTGLLPRATLGVDIPGVGRARGDFEISHLANDQQRGVIGTVGLELALAGFSAGGGAMFGSGLGTSSSVGEYATASISGYKTPGIPLPARAVSIRIEHTPDARAHINLMRELWSIARDRETVAVALVLRAEPADSLAHAEELADAIRLVRAHGKKVLCSWEDAGSRALYVCANADRTVVNPAGGLRYAGLRSQYIYLAGLLHKLGVNAQFIRIGPHKSAPEQFTNEHAGPVAQADHEDLLRENEAVFTKDVAVGRHMTEARVREVTTTGPFTADEAIGAGFANATAFDDELERVTSDLAGRSVSLQPYAADTPAPRQFGARSKVAVIVVEGDMVDGHSSHIPLVDMTLVGSYSVVDTIRQVKDDSTIKSVVLRIESPGGSSLAADVMWRAIEELAKVKPLVVSMGTFAASGGYYIASPARTIYALPLTVTGSIGVFFGKADVSGLLHKIGVNVDTERTTPHADLESIFRSFTPEETRALEVKVDQFYDTFLDRVSRGRHMTKAQVDALGRGRVWTGPQAWQRGLVDKMGGLRHALDEARQLGGLPDDAPIVELPSIELTLMDKAKAAVTLLSRAGADASVLELLPEQVKSLARALAPMMVYRSDVPLERLEWVPLEE